MNNNSFNDKDFSFDKFTKEVNSGKQLMGLENINKTLKYIEENKSAINYYYFMRIVWSVVMYNPRYVKDIPKYYIDEAMIKAIYKSDKRTYEYMTVFDRSVYLKEGFMWNVMRKVMKSIQVLKASLK